MCWKKEEKLEREEEPRTFSRVAFGGLALGWETELWIKILIKKNKSMQN